MAKFEPIKHVGFKSVASSSRENALIDRVNFNTDKYEALTATGMGVAVVDTEADRDALSTFPGMECYVLSTDTEYVYTSGGAWRALGSASTVGVRLERRSGTQAVASATDTVATYTDVAYTANGVTVDGSLSVVTVQNAGTYSVSSGWRSYNGGQKNAFITAGTAGSSLDGCFVCDSANAPDVCCSTIVPLDAGGSVKSWVWSDAAFDFQKVDGRIPFFAVFKVGNL